MCYRLAHEIKVNKKGDVTEGALVLRVCVCVVWLWLLPFRWASFSDNKFPFLVVVVVVVACETTGHEVLGVC